MGVQEKAAAIAAATGPDGRKAVAVPPRRSDRVRRKEQQAEKKRKKEEATQASAAAERAAVEAAAKEAAAGDATLQLMYVEGKTSDEASPATLEETPSKRRRQDADTQSSEANSPTDPELVKEVRAFMKTYKVSQVVVGQEARVSQAVISQWLSMKYHGYNHRVWPVPSLCSIHPVLS